MWHLLRVIAGLSSGALVLGFMALAGGSPATAATAASSAPANCPWLDQALPVSQRVAMLLPHMTIADKISMVTGQPGTSPAGAIGATPAIPRLCIPALSEEDGPIGVGDGLTGVTQLPAAVALSSSWDTGLARQYGTVLGAEEHGKGMEVDYGPTINIQRDPRWGRNFETLTEDPYLNGQLAAAEIRGIQSQDVISEVKHFDAYNQETYRNSPADNVIVSERALHEIYMPGFYSALIKGGAGAVMCAYSTVNGQYSCQNPDLLQTMEDRWAWPGFVSSDYGANHSTVASADAGMDQEMPNGTYYGSHLQAAVQANQVSQATLNDMVSRILTEMFRFGFFNQQPTGNTGTVVTSAAHAALARTAAEQGTVLLKNSGSVLPLGSGVSSIAVIGPDGSTSPMSAGGGSAHVNAPYVISPLQGIRERAGSQVTVTSYSGTDPAQAAAAAKAAQVAIVFASNFESEGSDLANITLQNNQDAYIQAVADANPDTVVVLNTGGPVTMPWISQVKSVLEAWYPGQEDGHAIAAVLFGDVNPAGHLPETFPQSLSQVPAASSSRFPGVNGEVHYSEGLDVGYRWYDASSLTPLFPFGYGLSYTTFAFSNLTVTPQAVSNLTSNPGAANCDCNGQGTPQVTVTARITNTGSRAGADVAQLYVGDPASAGEPPRQLKGFQKVYLQPGQSATVKFALTGHDLSYWDSTANGWVLPDGMFKVYVGDSSALANLPLRSTFQVVRTVGARYASLLVPATVTPGASFTATAHVVNDGDYPMAGTRFTLQVPSGWSAQAVPGTPSLVSPHQTADVSFHVTVPLSAQGTTAMLTARASYQPAVPNQTGLTETTATLAVAPLATGRLSPSSVLARPGEQAPVTLVLTSHVANTISVSYQASPPSGITVSPGQGSVTLAPTGASASLAVSVAPGTPGGMYSVPVSLTAGDQGGSYPLAAVTLQVSVPFASFPAAYGNVGITADSNTAPGHFDGANDSYSEQALTAAALAPGATVYQDGTTLTWPNVPAGKPDNVVAAGQTIDVHGQGSSLVLLGASNNGTGTGPLTITYTDGTSQTATISFADWYVNSPAPGNGHVAQTLHWNTGSGPGTQEVSVYSTAVPLDASKTVQSITLPNVNPAASGTELTMHLFAAAVSNGSASAAFSSLQAAYNNVGISTNADPAGANYDGAGYSFSEQALTAAGLAPGAALQQDGVTLTWPSLPAGQPDNVVAEGQTIKMSGSGTSLVLLGAANNGTATGTGVITYTDGTTQSFTISLADWYANAPAGGGRLVATTSNWNVPPTNTLGNHQVSVYSTAVPLQAGKTVQSVTLPAVSHGVGGGANAMHIFAMAVGG